jgi:hypothetical protein
VLQSKIFTNRKKVFGDKLRWFHAVVDQLVKPFEVVVRVYRPSMHRVPRT